METENEKKWYSAWLKESNKNDELRDKNNNLNVKNKKLRKLRNWFLGASIVLAFSPSISSVSLSLFKGELSIERFIEITLGKNIKPSNISIYITPKPDIEINSIEGIDQNNDTITFIVFITQGQEAWEFGDSIKLHRKGSEIFDFVEKHISKNTLFQDSYDIICVGLASEEGELESQTHLAQTRGENLSKAVFSSVNVNGNERRIYSLNFGQHLGDNKSKVSKEATKCQRSIIIVGVMKKNKSKKEIEYALKEAMDKHFKDADYYYKKYSETKNSIILKEQYRIESN